MHRYGALVILIIGLIFGFLFESRDPPVAPRETRTGFVKLQTSDLEEATSRSIASDSKPLASQPVPPNDNSDPSDLCGWAKSIRGAQPDEALDLLSKLKDKLSQGDLDTLAWLYQVPSLTPATETSTELLFLKGLEESGILLGRATPRRLNIDKAISFLEKAQAQDAGNGAVDLYLAALYQRKGNYKRATESYHRGLKAERFDVYMNQLSKRLLAAPDSSMAFLKAVDLFSTMPIPDLNPLRDSLLSLSHSEDFSGDIFVFAQKIVDEAVNSRAPYNHLDWWLSSYVLAGQLLRNRGQNIARSFELNQEYNRFPSLPNMSSTNETCNNGDLDRDIQSFQAIIR